MRYITGGLYEGNGKTYEGCVDKTPPLYDKPFLIPYELYFGKESPSWNGGGVAFIDADKPGITLGRAYLITENQFLDIQKQEGSWYEHIVELINGGDDIPHKTFTGISRYPENSPSKNYMDVIFKGLCETYPQLVFMDNNLQTSQK